MVWYAKAPPPPPDWDICWDFNKAAKKGSGNQGWGGNTQSWGAGGGSGRGWGGGRGGRGGRGRWSSDWDNSQGFAWTPPWWIPTPMKGMMPWPMAQTPMTEAMGSRLIAAMVAPTGKPGKDEVREGAHAGAVVDDAAFDLGSSPPSLQRRLLEKDKMASTAQSPPQPLPRKEYEGSVKSLSARHGYGFIACAEVHSVYGRDVYLPKDAVPDGVQILDRLRFNITLSSKGHPQAKNVTIAAKV